MRDSNVAWRAAVHIALPDYRVAGEYTVGGASDVDNRIFVFSGALQLPFIGSEAAVFDL